MDIKNILKILILNLLLLGCGRDFIDNEKIVYYDWAMIERFNGKPAFSVRRNFNEIEKIKDKNYYKVYYKNNIVQKVFTYEHNKIVRKDYMDSNGTWVKYILPNDTVCSVIYTHNKNNIIHNIECTNGMIYKNKYLDGKLIESKKYKNNQLIDKLVIDGYQCKEYNQNNKLLKTYKCYPYEETRPIEPDDFPRSHSVLGGNANKR
jgi:hypothetical protein